MRWMFGSLLSEEAPVRLRNELTGLMLVTESIEQLAAAVPAGALPPARPALQPGREIATLHARTPGASLSATIAFLGNSPDGGPVW